MQYKSSQSGPDQNPPGPVPCLMIKVIQSSCLGTGTVRGQAHFIPFPAYLWLRGFSLCAREHSLLIGLFYLLPLIFPRDHSCQHFYPVSQASGEGILLTLPQKTWVESFLKENKPSSSHISNVLGLKGGKEDPLFSAVSIRWPHPLLGKM